MKLAANIFFCLFLHSFCGNAQLMEHKTIFTLADTLRGSITKYRTGWDVLKYELTVQPDLATKTISGKNNITYYEEVPVFTMQIDLQQPLIIDSIVAQAGNHYQFKRDGNVCFVALKDSLAKYKFLPGVRSLTVYYHGQPKEAKKAPWDGGLIWKTDVMGNPWIGTACQGLGASVWWPCKDHQSDEPDSGMVIHIIAPDTLVAVGNGRLRSEVNNSKGYKTWTWEVKNPINTYSATMNIGKYVSFSDTLMGEGGKLDLQYWVLDYNLDKAKQHFQQVKPMIQSHEFWFGKYPFYEDGYKLVETPFLGMEHQSAIAYGNNYQNGYYGKDLSGTGEGLKWDFIIIHESGHEWFGNNITSKDIADMWIHEGFTNYSEVLYTQYVFSKENADDYCVGIRKNIKNNKNIIGYYGVNKEGSGDMYYKAANMLHMIRRTVNNDSTFRNILRGLNSNYYHKTVTTEEVENYITEKSGKDLSKIFDQYLRTTQIPKLEYYYNKRKHNLYYRWTNCITNFSMPLLFKTYNNEQLIFPTEKWNSTKMTDFDQASFNAAVLKYYYIQLNQVKGKR